MEQRPTGFDDGDVRSALSTHHGVDACELRYRAVGFGDYHWEVTGGDGRRWFVKERRSGRPAVVTHGEPHPGNLLGVDDGYLLIDWDTVGLGVPERDLAVVPGDLAVYTELSGLEPDPRALELYRLQWDLADLGEFLRWFQNPHSDDADSGAAWEGLRQTLDSLELKRP